MAHFRIVARIRERPLFGSKRLLWITRADHVQEIDPAALLERNRKTCTTLILEGPEKALATWSKTIPVYQMSAPANVADRTAWYTYLAKQQDLTLHRSALEPILTTFEGSLGPVDRLFREIRRTLANVPLQQGGNEVTEAVLLQHGITSHYKTVFELIRGLENGDRQFFKEWERILGGGQSPFGLISLLHRQWKLYRVAKGSLPEEEVAAIAGVSSHAAGQIVRTARRLSRESVRQGIEALCEADALLKAGLSPGLVMDRLAATLFVRTAPPKDPQRPSGPKTHSGVG